MFLHAVQIFFLRLFRTDALLIINNAYVKLILGTAKLKDMGNSLLGRFGMSIDNFKAVKDPNTGSYSIAFQQ